VATIVAGSSFALNMLAPGSFSAAGPSNVLSYSSSLIVVSAPDGDAQYYEGDFLYADVPGVGTELSGGTLTGYQDFTPAGLLRGSITNFSVDLSTYLGFAERNDAQGLDDYILNQAPATVTGSDFADVLLGGQLDDTLTGGGGNDVIDGRGGSNTAVYSGFRANYQISAVNGVVTVADARGIDGTDRLTNVQSLRFADGTVGIVPLVTAPNQTVGRGASLSAASLVSVSDALAIVEYQFWDNTADPASGRFVLNGVDQPALTTIHVTPAQLAALSFQSGSGADDLYVRAVDGASASGWVRFSVTAPVDAAPVVAALGAGGRAQQIAATSLFSTSDADGDAITRYQLWDPAAGNGGFTINGAAQSARQVLDLTSLAGLAWDTTGQSSTAVFSVRAFDGLRWSDWASVSVGSGETPPTVTSLGAIVHSGVPLGAAQLFRTDDREGDAITRYELWDPTAGNGGFTIGGVSEAARQDLLVSDPTTIGWDTTGQNGQGVFAMRAFDGLQWSDWTTVRVNAADAAPSVTSLGASAHGANPVAASSLFQASDPEGDTLTRYELWDPVAGNGGLAVNGQLQAARQVISLDASALASLAWDGAGQTGSAVFSVRAYDGTAWSDWSSVTVAPSPPPTVAALDPTVAAGQQVALSSLFQVSDPNSIVAYELWDPVAGHGGFTDGTGIRPARQVITSSVADVATLDWDTTGQDGTAVFAIRAYNGSEWSDWTTVGVNATPPAVSLPVAAGVVTTAAIADVGTVAAAGFNYVVSDAFGATSTATVTIQPASTAGAVSQLVTALATSAADQNGTVTTPLAPTTETLPTLAASQG
jgi:hypothetical protein